jgi:lipopolysaccharide biosynthesis glycosyltransferase
MIPGDFSDEGKNIVSSAAKQFENCELIYHNMMDLYHDALVIDGHHVTTPSYYRLRLSTLLPDEDQCLYLDADTIVCEDIVPLYKTDLAGYFIAGVKAAGYHCPPGSEVCYTHEEWDEAIAHPVVIHYADKFKPWKDIATDFSEVWWTYFLRSTPCRSQPILRALPLHF